jgi:hypothetical protein
MIPAEPPVEPPEAAPEQATVAATPAVTSPGDQRKPRMDRLYYAIEFLLALISIHMLWSEIGGQSHLDMMPWYTKLGLILALAWCAVLFTVAIVAQERAWTRHSRAWFFGIVVVVAVMAGVTYYYHVHEVVDEPDSDDNSVTSTVGSPASTAPGLPASLAG